MKPYLRNVNCLKKLNNLFYDFVVDTDKDAFNLSFKHEINTNNDFPNQKFKFIKNNEKLYSKQTEDSKVSTYLGTLHPNDDITPKNHLNQVINQNKKDTSIEINTNLEKFSLYDHVFENFEEEANINSLKECMKKNCLTLEGGVTRKRSQNKQQTLKQEDKYKNNATQNSTNGFLNTLNTFSSDKVITHLLKTSRQNANLNIQRGKKNIADAKRIAPSNNIELKLKNYKNMKLLKNKLQINKSQKVDQNKKNKKMVKYSDFELNSSEIEITRNHEINKSRIPFQFIYKTVEENQLDKDLSNCEKQMSSKAEVYTQLFSPNRNDNVYKPLNYINDKNENIIKNNPEKMSANKILKEYTKYCPKINLDFIDMRNLLKKMKFLSSAYIKEEEQILCRKLWEILNGNTNKVISSHNFLIMLMIISKFLNNMNEVLDYSSILCII